MEKRERDGDQLPQDNAASKMARTADGQPPPPPGGVQFQQPVTLVPSAGGYMAIPSGGYVIQAGPGFSSTITVMLTIPFDAKGFIIGKRGAALQQMAQVRNRGTRNPTHTHTPTSFGRMARISQAVHRRRAFASTSCWRIS
jgi:hypothetical protein